MGTDALALIVSILMAIGVYTASIVGLVLWLTSKFRGLEILIYKEMNSLKEETREDIKDIRDRLYRVELQTFGVSGPGLPSI